MSNRLLSFSLSSNLRLFDAVSQKPDHRSSTINGINSTARNSQHPLPYDILLAILRSPILAFPILDNALLQNPIKYYPIIFTTKFIRFIRFIRDRSRSGNVN